MNTPLAPEHLEALRRLDACTLANAIETFHARLRDEGFMDSAIRCLFPSLQPMLGYAATVKIRGSAPPTVDGPYPDRTDWWDHIASQPAPRIVVIQDVATRPGLGALVGEVHMNILQALNCVVEMLDRRARGRMPEVNCEASVVGVPPVALVNTGLPFTRSCPVKLLVAPVQVLLVLSRAVPLPPVPARAG